MTVLNSERNLQPRSPETAERPQAPGGSPANGSRSGSRNGLKRLLRLRLVIPVLRSRHEPEYTARGVAIGMLVAMTPTVGVQMPIVLLFWFIVKALRPAWNFNPVLAMAWTWVTNVVTVPPVYYTFLLTGELMLGRWGSSGGYDAFQARLEALLGTEAGFFEALWVYAVGIFDAWGVPMFVGCIPWAIGLTWLSYRWSLKISRRTQARRARKPRSVLPRDHA